MKRILTKDNVKQAIQDLVSHGKKPTQAAILASLGGGSMGTLVRIRAEIDTEARALNDSPEALKLFREVWGQAVKVGREEQESVIMELRESIEALAAENERLEGAFVGEKNRAEELEKEKLRVERELIHEKNQVEEQLKQARAAHVAATEQAAGALQKLAESQAACAAQVAAVQADLNIAVGRSHEFELRAARAEALVEAKRLRPHTKKGKHGQDSRDQPDHVEN